jgi:hypothetical protein
VKWPWPDEGETSFMDNYFNAGEAVMEKENCWEYKKCGRQPGGDKIAELGPCPAVSCFKAHEINDGINGGRACWAIAGTFCGGQVQGIFIEKHKDCVNCDFFHQVANEEGKNLLAVDVILSKIRCKG